jgi:hypothetical protein
MTITLTPAQANYLRSLLEEALESLEDAQQTSDSLEIASEIEASREILSQLSETP